MSETKTFYVLIHMEDLQFVNTGGEYFTTDIMESIKFETLEDAQRYRKGFDFPEEFEIYEVSYSYMLKRTEWKENDETKQSNKE